MEEKLIELTEEQKKIVLDQYDKMSLPFLTKLIFKDESLDGRSNQGKAIKKFLSEQSKEIRTSKYEKMPSIELTEENKAFLKDSIENKNSRPIELARIIFKNDKLSQNSKEFRAVYEYVKSIDPNQAPMADEPVDNREYKPPMNVQAIAGRVNEYVQTGDSQKKIYDPNNLKPAEEKRCKILMSYMKSIRFTYQASSYDKKIDRILFESEFVRFTYDKEDLTKEEITQYVSLCAEIVNEARTERILSHLQNDVEMGLASSDPETRKYSQGLSENVNAWRQKVEASKKAQAQLLDKLTESRAQRLEGKMNQNASVLSLLDLWINEENRKQLIDLGKREKEEDKEEVKRIKSFDDVVAICAGQTEEEAGS